MLASTTACSFRLDTNKNEMRVYPLDIKEPVYSSDDQADGSATGTAGQATDEKSSSTN